MPRRPLLSSSLGNYTAYFPPRGDLNKCLNFPPDPSPSAGGTAGSPWGVPMPVEDSVSGPGATVPSMWCGAHPMPIPAMPWGSAVLRPPSNGAKPAATLCLPCERLTLGLGQKAP